MSSQTNLRTNIVFLLTGSINTFNKDFTNLNDPQKRRKDYINSIEHYLKHFNYPLVFVENSNEDLSGYVSDYIKMGRLEVLYFEGNSYPARFGKGLGEMRSIEFAITNSVLINENCFVFKITGRYIIQNAKRFINFYQSHSDAELIADLTNNFTNSQSGIFGFKPFFAKKYLFKYDCILNDSEGVYFEHALARAVLSAMSDRVKFYIFRYYPRIKAISGTTGKPYKRRFIYFFPRMMKYLIRYIIVIR